MGESSQNLSQETLQPVVTPPDVSVSIVSYNTCELLRACLLSLRARQNEGEATLEVIVADNGSSDGSPEMVESEFPEVQLVKSGGNIGYGRANNIALEKARGRYFFVLNSDTEVQPGALRTMCRFMDAHPDVGAVGARLVLSDGSTQPSCARDPGLLSVFWEQTYLYKLLPNNRITGGYTMTNWDYNDQRDVEQVCGACLFVRREAYRQIGGFDPAYFMYFEDTDFCVRLRRAGWRIYFLPDAPIFHHLGGSSSSDWHTRARMIASYNKSRYYYFTHNAGTLQGRALRAITLMGAGLRLSGWGFLSLIRPSTRQQVRLFREVWRQTWKMTPHGESPRS
jgi:GT2 family glycosyltransferase